jgi:hypothetical protein
MKAREAITGVSLIMTALRFEGMECATHRSKVGCRDLALQKPQRGGGRSFGIANKC